MAKKKRSAKRAARRAGGRARKGMREQPSLPGTSVSLVVCCYPPPRYIHLIGRNGPYSLRGTGRGNGTPPKSAFPLRRKSDHGQPQGIHPPTFRQLSVSRCRHPRGYPSSDRGQAAERSGPQHDQGKNGAVNMVLYATCVNNASVGATAGTFDNVGSIQVRNDATKLLGFWSKHHRPPTSPPSLSRASCKSAATT